MMRSLSVISALLLLCGCSVPEVEVPYVPGGMDLCGCPQDWGPSRGLVKMSSSSSDNEASVGLAWSDDGLYVLFEVLDSNIRAFQTEKDHRELFLDDVVEVLLDSGCDRGREWVEDDLIYHVNALGVKKDDRGTPEGKSDPSYDLDFTHRVTLQGTLNDESDVDRGYIVEIFMPWTELGTEPRKGLRIGAEFACGDNDGKGKCQFDWLGIYPFRQPHLFGILTLSE